MLVVGRWWWRWWFVVIERRRGFHSLSHSSLVDVIIPQVSARGAQPPPRPKSLPKLLKCAGGCAPYRCRCPHCCRWPCPTANHCSAMAGSTGNNNSCSQEEGDPWCKHLDPARRVFIARMDPGWRVAIETALRDDEENSNWVCRAAKEAAPPPFIFQYVLRRPSSDAKKWGFSTISEHGMVQVWTVSDDTLVATKNQRLAAMQNMQNQCLSPLDIIECANGVESPNQILHEIKYSSLMHLRVQRPSNRDRHLFEGTLLLGGWMIAKQSYNPSCEPEEGYLNVQKGSPLWVFSNTVAAGDDDNLFQRYAYAQISHPMPNPEHSWKTVWEKRGKGWLPTAVLMLAPRSFGWHFN